MTRRLIICILLLTACQSIPISPTIQPTSRPTSSPLPPPTLTPTPTTTPKPDFIVRYHPEDGIYIGELVSFEILNQTDTDLSGHQITISSDSDPALNTTTTFTIFGIGQKNQATMQWAWDTIGLPPGEYTLTFTISPDGPTWQESITLTSTDLLPPNLINNTLAYTETDCCLLYYLTNTAAERDLKALEIEADKAADEITTMMGVELEEPISIFMMPRVLGHGGFASNELYLSYLDRNYTNNVLQMVFKHEIVHRLDAQQASKFRPIMLTEGMAVYLSGGHFKPEPLMPRAAALFDLGWYIPITTLVEDFYTHQHEISYLEAAALLEYMVDRWGYEKMIEFYYNISPIPEGGHAAAIDAALQEFFDITFETLEQDFIAALKALPPDPANQADIYLTVTFYDTLRRYQQSLDPSAYFGSAWLVLLDNLQERSITADVIRHPSQPANLAIETMLISASEYTKQGDYQQAEEILKAVNIFLDQIEAYPPNTIPYGAFNLHPLLWNYLSIVEASLEKGYQPIQITTINENSAELIAIKEYGAELFYFELKLDQQGFWEFE